MNIIKQFSACARFATPFAFATLVVVLIGLLPVSADSVTPAPLTLRTHITLNGNSVRLGDIFDGFQTPQAGVKGDTIVAYAPQPGRRAVFDANWLSRIAQRYRLNWRPTTRLDRVIVERASTVINAEDLVAALRDEIKARGNMQDIELELSNRNLLVHIDSSLPPTLEVIHISTDSRRGKFSAVISMPAGDPQARRINVVGQMHAVVEVPVLSRALRPGSPIRPTDIVWKRVRANQVRNDIVTDPSDFEGREPKRPLNANTMVRRTDLQTPLTVSKGMLVTMIFHSSSMVLTASGRALEAGTVGDFISVRNTQTKTTVDAKVIGPNRVEVAALRQLAFSEGETQ